MFTDSVVHRLMPFDVPAVFTRVLASAIALPEIQRLYGQIAVSNDPREIASSLLNALNIRAQISDADLKHVPRTGATIVVANHPHGILDGALLIHLLKGVRQDVKLLANGILNVIPELRDVLIDVDPIAGPSAASRNLSGLRQAYEHLAAGGLIVIFPAGEVSHLQGKSPAVTDSVWNNIVPRLVSMLARTRRGTAVVPVYIDGRNSLLFQAAGLLHSRLRTLLLVRELLKKRGEKIAVRLGHSISSGRLMQMSSDSERNAFLRWRTYLLAPRVQKRQSKRHTRPIASPVPVAALEQDVNTLPHSALLTVSGDLEVYIASAAQIPNLLGEIGRLRELTFRDAGEGTGETVDLDSFDREYLHLFLWNAQKREVVGAYRLAGTDRVRSLYTQTLFHYTDEFLDEIRPALELGRSFVRPEYQRSFNALLLLWKGIGNYLEQNPRYRMLYGSVSISDEYQSASRELMVQWLDCNASRPTWKRLVSGMNPFGVGTVPDSWVAQFDELEDIVSDIEPDRRSVPILLRHYLKLGGKVLAFTVDRDFSNVLDGLIVVDLDQTEPRLLARYFGAREAASYLAFGKESYAA